MSLPSNRALMQSFPRRQLLSGWWSRPQLLNALNAGSVWINDHTLFSPDVPRGGYGDSGKENGVLGAEELTRMKQLSLILSDGRR
jgi:hypothetical protein